MLGSPPPNEFWGKLQRVDSGNLKSPVVAWHPLIDHCADVSACLIALLGTRSGGFKPGILNRRLAALGACDMLTEVQVARLGVLAALHDVGKFNHGFQNKALPHPVFTNGHVREGMVFPDCGNPWSGEFGSAAALHCLDDWAAGGVRELLAAAISHHGRPAEVWRPTHVELARCWGIGVAGDPLVGVARLVDATRRWLPQAWLAGSPSLPDQPAFQHAFCGMVQLADWLGSDTDFFPFSAAGEGDRWPLALASAGQAIAAVGLEGEAARKALGGTSPTFAQVSSFAPRPMQVAVGVLPLPATASLALIEEETGGGKTEAAFWHFARLFSAGAVDGLFFALPTRTAATQVYERIRLMRDRCFVDPNTRPPIILAVPGYLRADGATGRPLPDFEVLWQDDPVKADRHRRWAAESPKRFLAGAIVIGTIDQALLAALAVDHAHLRSACLLRHLLVVDEVHASDAYMTRLTSELLTRTRTACGHALLMSATLGASARDQMLTAWHGRPATTSLGDAIAAPYPALWQAGQPPQALKRIGRDRTVALRTDGADDPAIAAEAALNVARNGARVLIIRNTVKDCLATQSALEATVPPELLWRMSGTAGLVPAPHHARFAREDRVQLDQAIERDFGKNAVRDGGRVACATQTVQQALDLDADFLVTDLAPVDVLLQRLGRLHRHERQRCPGCEQPTALILVPQDSMACWLSNPRSGPHGWGTVYDDLRILEATRRLVLDSTWHISADNRSLVEGATHPDALARLDAEDPRWGRHGNEVLGRTIAQRDRARLGLLTWSAGFGDDAVLFPSGDLSYEIRTRLGEGDRRILLPKPVLSPFGQKIKEFTIPAHLLRGVRDDGNAEVEEGSDCVEVTIGVSSFRYSRLGLQRQDDHG